MDDRLVIIIISYYVIININYVYNHTKGTTTSYYYHLAYQIVLYSY